MDRKALELFDLSAMVSTEPFREPGEANRVDRDHPEFQSADSDRGHKLENRRDWPSSTRRKSRTTRCWLRRRFRGSSPPVQLNGEPYVDGGLLMNTPLKAAIDLGADVIHVIALDPAIAERTTVHSA